MSRAVLYMRLGRVSNLPTVWSNTLAGAVLGGGEVAPASIALLALAMSLLYVGGMFLNDAFDREIDRRERPERPIPAGLISAGEVFAVGFSLLGAGIVLAYAISGARGALPAAALAAAIVLYDAWHKKNPASPLLMGICRVLVYVTAALATTSAAVTGSLLLQGAAVLLAYLMGLTYVAKQENLAEVKNLWPLLLLAAPLLWAVSSAPDLSAAIFFVALAAWIVRCVRLLRDKRPGNIPKAVVGLIAGISLLDALVIAKTGGGLLGFVAAAAFPLTLAGQRYVKGT